MASSVGPPILPLLKRRTPTSTRVLPVKEKRSRRRPLNMAEHEEANVLAQDAGASTGNSLVERHTPAQCIRDGVRKRAFFRGLRCAAGPPGLSREEYEKLEHYTPCDDNGEFVLHNKPNELFVPADEDRTHELEGPYEGPVGPVSELRLCAYNIEDEFSGDTGLSGSIFRGSDDAELSCEDIVSRDLLTSVDRHLTHIDEGTDLDVEDVINTRDTYVQTSSVKGEHDSAPTMDFGSQQCNINSRGCSCSSNPPSAELNKQATAQVEGLFDYLQYADTFFNIVDAVRLSVVNRTLSVRHRAAWGSAAQHVVRGDGRSCGTTCRFRGNATRGGCR